MRTRTPLSTAPSLPLPDSFQAELDSFLLSCEAENLAPNQAVPIRLTFPVVPMRGSKDSGGSACSLNPAAKPFSSPNELVQ
jgi:hypothetical protein